MIVMLRQRDATSAALAISTSCLVLSAEYVPRDDPLFAIQRTNSGSSSIANGTPLQGTSSDQALVERVETVSEHHEVDPVGFSRAKSLKIGLNQRPPSERFFTRQTPNTPFFIAVPAL